MSEEDATTTATKEEGGCRTHAMGPTRECWDDVKILCRLIGLHSRPGLACQGKAVSFSMISQEYEFHIQEVLDIGNNVKCIICEEPYSAYRMRASKTPVTPHLFTQNDRWLTQPTAADDRHIIMAFNWFSPKSMWDYVSLGMQIVTQTELDKKKGVVGSIYLEKAEDFAWNPKMLKWLDENGITAGTGSMLMPNNIKQITFTGFSFGGAIAHAFAYYLRTTKRIEISMQVVGMGCPRPGSPLLTKWFYDQLTPDSVNVILYDEVFRDGKTCVSEYDPVTQGPSTDKGFDYHPNCFLLNRKFGTMRPLSPSEHALIGNAPTGFRSLLKIEKNTLWDKLHGVIKYYEGMYGLGT